MSDDSGGPGTYGGYGEEQTAYSNYSSVSKAFPWRVVDYNADGRHDLLIYDNTQWKVVLSEPQPDGSWRLGGMINTGLTEKETEFFDANSDGLIDAAYLVDEHLYLRFLRHDTTQQASSAYYYHYGDEYALADLRNDYALGSKYEIQSGFDFNGDGVGDLLLRIQLNVGFPGSGGTITNYYAVLLDGNESPAVPPVYFHHMANSSNRAFWLDRQAVDINSDGLTDIYYRRPEPEQFYDRNSYYRLNTGNGFGEEVSLGELPQSTYGVDESKARFVDYNNDGFQDLLWEEKIDTYNGKVWVRYWHDDGFETAFEARSTGSELDVNQFLDSNGDGQLDYIVFHYDRIYGYLGHNPQANKITGIENGVGNRFDISYESLAQTNHYDRLTVSTAEQCEDRTIFGNTLFNFETVTFNYCYTTGAPFYEQLNGDWDVTVGNQIIAKTNPVLEILAPLYVVTQVAGTAPIVGDASAKSKISYFYGEAKIQAAGRGMLGFHKIRTQDHQSGVETTTTYRQDFPFIGYPEMTEVRSIAGHLLSSATNDWQLENWNNANPTKPYQPYLAQSIETTFEVVGSGASQGNALHTVTTTNVYDDYNNDGVSDLSAPYGNVTTIVVTSQDAVGNILSTVTADNAYGPSDWSKQMGRLSRTDITSVRGSDTRTRASSFSYYTAGALRGLLHTETIEPDDASYTLTTTYAYDDVGNQEQATVSGTGIQSRTTSTYYDSLGRYPTHTVNAYGQTTQTILTRNDLGQPLRVADINGIETHYTYGKLGRRYFEANEAGQFTQTLMIECDNDCPASAQYGVETKSAGGARRIEYFDALVRKVRSSVQQFDSDFGHVDTQYDSSGRVARQSQPHSNVALDWTIFQYDVLGRIISTDLPGVTNNISVNYTGLTTVTTNPLGQTKTKITNALGELIDVYDDHNGHLSYSYNATGDLIKTTHHGSYIDPHSVSVDICYDKLGRKTAMSDPDKGGWERGSNTSCPSANTNTPVPGWWLYQYNVLGELTQQIDAKGQRVQPGYDLLGRMTSRIDLQTNGATQGSTLWSYNNNTTSGNALGALTQVQDNISAYSQVINHDNFARVSTTTTTIAPGDSHHQKVTYDQFGRTFQRFDAAGDGSWQDNGVEHEYNSFGYLQRIKNAIIKNGVQENYYTVNAMDLRGNVVEYESGNGVTTTRHYNTSTGRLERIQADLLLGTGDIQDIDYDWDDIGNLNFRHDRSGSKDSLENFDYDDLNRLTDYQVVGQTAHSVRYNSLGNISYKSDVCSTASDCYNYGSNAGPHAATQVDGVNFLYDSNGNNTSSSDGRSIIYSTFDKPLSITKGSHTTDFKYGPDRSRYQRTDTNANGITTTKYIGNVEKITKPDNTQAIKRYLPGDVMITITLDGGGNETDSSTQYLHKDHLGSLDVITNELGEIQEQYAFDPWGKRRSALSWAQLTQPQLVSFDHSLTTRGFTGHEMLDEVGLIHMNGRVYDPKLGRFLQADPIIDGVTNTQGYNRYSYLHNNPLNATDPTGYSSRGFFTALKIVVGIAIYVLCPACGPGYYAAAFGAIGAVEAIYYGGSFLDVAIAAFSGAVTGFLGASLSGGISWETFGFGLVGGITTAIQGGKFGHGFISAYVGAAIGGTQWFKGLKPAIQHVGRVVIGGTVSKLTGGKFANGAVTAAFASLLSEGARVHAEKSTSAGDG
ncbi:MAG: VCBS repeat-containing protein, partial [Spongiibacteraceae bacterium]|nr:VCBS repeat-containing protein [Spongiibacteraceae bacterium]